MRSLTERLREALAPDYEVQHELAAGGMGVVFLARDVALDRRVAVKVLLPEIATEVAAQRFLREARILASMSHSHIIPVHYVGEADGLFYYVMDYMEGDTLADALRSGPMSVGGAVKLGTRSPRCTGGGTQAGHRPSRHQTGQRILAGQTGTAGRFRYCEAIGGDG